MSEHLKPFEAAARILCDMDGVDPDATQQMPHPLINGLMVDFPAWHNAAEALLNLSKMLTALKRAAQQPLTAENNTAGEQVSLFQ